MARRLYADIGNSRVKLADCSGSAPQIISVWPSDDAPQLPQDEVELVVVSVVPAALERLKQAAQQRASMVPLRCLGAEIPCPLRLDYATPQSLGMDRVAAAFAAWQLSPGGALVLSAGTALTLDWVDAHGVFRGGLIAPGRSALARGLATAAPLLPLPTEAASFPARTSAECVALGLDVAFSGVVSAALQRARAACGSELPLWICGGDAAAAARVLSTNQASGPMRIDEHLVLRGLARCDEP